MFSEMLIAEEASTLEEGIEPVDRHRSAVYLKCNVVAIPDSTLLVAADLFRQSEKDQEDPRRPHLGASLIGDSCDRKIWYTFRWADLALHDGRTLRIFRRGKREEAELLADLRAVGYELESLENRISGVDGHFGGTLDGVIRGIPAAPKTWHVLELKTSNTKRWAELSKHGVQEAQPRHYAQVQAYMHGVKLDRALYLAVNKDDERIYEERIPLDQLFAQRLFDKAHRLIHQQHVPGRISDDPGWYECRSCDFHSICHVQKLPDRNCRTCLHSSVETEGRWHCAKHKIDLDEAAQKAGCPDQLFLPLLLYWLELTDASDSAVFYRQKDGTEWKDTGP